MHHAEVWLGTELRAVLPPELLQQTADVVHYVQPQWGINDSRQLAAAAQVLPVTAPLRTLIVCTTRLTHEAQNALLKLLEEPPATTRFILVVPDTGRLLPTVLSRVFVHTTRDTDTSVDDWRDFKTASYKDRLTQIAEASKQKDTTWQQTMLSAAIADSTVPAAVRLLLDTHATRSGASRKMLLEEVALSLPIGASVE